MPRKSHYGTTSTETSRGYSYMVDGRGEIIRNEDGEEVIKYMRQVTWNVLRYDLLTHWDHIDKDRKEYIVGLIKEQYPQPDRSAEFNEKWMIQEMGKLLGHRRSEARDAYKEGKSRPAWCDEEIWELIKEERDGNPNLFQQQVEARSQQQPSEVSHLGSGGKAALLRDFEAAFGRRPTRFEKHYAQKNGFPALAERLEQRDEWPPAPLCEDEVSD